eukprot:817263-Prymnesium_polylepis.1
MIRLAKSLSRKRAGCRVGCAGYGSRSPRRSGRHARRAATRAISSKPTRYSGGTLTHAARFVHVAP